MIYRSCKTQQDAARTFLVIAVIATLTACGGNYETAAPVDAVDVTELGEAE